RRWARCRAIAKRWAIRPSRRALRAIPSGNEFFKPDDLLRIAGKGAIFAAKIEQRLSLMNFRILDFPDKNGVISGKMRRDDAATQMEERPLQHGNAGGCPAVTNRKALLGPRALFALREVF